MQPLQIKYVLFLLKFSLSYLQSKIFNGSTHFSMRTASFSNNNFPGPLQKVSSCAEKPSACYRNYWEASKDSLPKSCKERYKN